MDKKKKMTLEELNTLYTESESADKTLYSEMRSNVLLVAGEHYSKNVNKHFARLRETNRLSETGKLRLTKNHMYRVSKTYKNAILDKAPGVQITPKNEMEMQDRKSAELNDAVWTDQVERNDLDEKIDQWAGEFVDIGECAVKIFWDPTKGHMTGYEPKMDDFGYPELDENGFSVEDKSKPIYTGDVCYETIYGFNLFRDPSAKSMKESSYIGIRKMVKKDILEKRYKGDKEKLKALEIAGEKEFVVFDSNKASYKKEKDTVLVKEVYLRPSTIYPNGYFYFHTTTGILEHGELPGGIFPIVWEGFDIYATNPRGRSILKVARPYQAEINRSASQQATHQVTLGDDKILYQAGSKLTQGALLPGVRGISFQGAAPTVLPGRTGTQYSDYTKDQIYELDKAVFLDGVTAMDQNGLDPYAMLFRSMSQQAKFKPFIKKFSRFLVKVCELSLKTCKMYMEDDMIIKATGRSEAVNIEEFKNTSPFDCQVVVKEMSESIDTMLGKQITFQHTLQYIGNSLKPEDIGKILKNMPFMNNEESFGDLTLSYENVTNDMLAIERGEKAQISPEDDNAYYIGKLANRIRKSDFKLLSPEIQQEYHSLLEAHKQQQVEKAQAIKAAQAEFIPTDGAMVAVDMYVPNDDPEKAPKRARIPQKAVEWLLSQLESQGMSLDKMEEMNQGVLADIAKQLQSRGQLPQQNIPQQPAI